MQKAWLGVTFAAMVLSLGGCGKKADECTAMINVANKDTEAIKAAAATKPDAGAKDLAAATRATADAADKLAADLAKQVPTTEELQKMSGEYQAMAKAVAKAARDYAEVLDHLALLEPKVRADVADPALKSMMAAQEKVKQSCAEHPAPECKTIADMTASVMTMAEKPEQLDKLEADLGKIGVKDTTLLPQIFTLRGAINTLAKTLRDAAEAAAEIKAAETKLKAASMALDAALTKEAPITASINAFCSK